MSKKNAVAFVKPPEPAFLTAFKKKAGFKEGPSVDTKVGPICKHHEVSEKLVMIFNIYKVPHLQHQLITKKKLLELTGLWF